MVFVASLLGNPILMSLSSYSAIRSQRIASKSVIAVIWLHDKGKVYSMLPTSMLPDLLLTYLVSPLCFLSNVPPDRDLHFLTHCLLPSIGFYGTILLAHCSRYQLIGICAWVCHHAVAASSLSV